MVFESTVEQWGNFNEAVSFYKQIPNPGNSSRVRYNDERDAAYVVVFPNVEESFMFDAPHVTSGVKVMTFIKDPFTSQWKIFAFGDPVDPFKRNNIV